MGLILCERLILPGLALGGRVLLEALQLGNGLVKRHDLEQLSGALVRVPTAVQLKLYACKTSALDLRYPN